MRDLEGCDTSSLNLSSNYDASLSLADPDPEVVVTGDIALEIYASRRDTTCKRFREISSKVRPTQVAPKDELCRYYAPGRLAVWWWDVLVNSEPQRQGMKKAYEHGIHVL